MRNHQEANYSRDALEAAIRVHDAAALGLMKQAGRHLREASALTRQLDNLDRRDERGPRSS